jgi:5-(carboxyamino)imidazole ribonucleotide synthase
MKVGILGGGQLGRMMALAGYPLGLNFRFFDANPDTPGSQVAEQTTAKFDDSAALARFADGLDVLTYEFENVPAATAHAVAKHAPVFPAPSILEMAQDRLTQKNWFKEFNVATAPFANIENEAQLEAAVAEVALPAVIKTRRSGYDGKGQLVLRSWHDAERVWKTLGGVPLIAEGFVPFERELSIVAARSRSGETVFYPLVENHHREGILRLTLAPAPGWTPELQATAEGMARRVMEALQYVGVLTIELFQYQGQLLANEMATRVHNSGHWSIEGAHASQFENHIRAVAGMPLGSTAPRGVSAMLNLIGEVPASERVLSVVGAHLHLYGKSPARGRKLGHITVVEASAGALSQTIERIRDLPGVMLPVF